MRVIFLLLRESIDWPYTTRPSRQETLVCGLLWRVVSRRELKEQAGRADLRPLIVWGQYHTAALLQSGRLLDHADQRGVASWRWRPVATTPLMIKM